jgi:hypothetical protein
VRNFAVAAPELVRFCGLEWEEACRDFSASDRVIATMSTVQARQPLTEAKGRSGRYAPHLSPLIEALRDAHVDLRSGARVSDRASQLP